MTIYKRLLEEKFPGLKRKLQIAKIDEPAAIFLKKKVTAALYLSLGMSVLTFFYVDKTGGSILLVPISFAFWFMIILFILLKSVDSAIAKRRQEIDKDVLFAGRFLLVKLNSGRPLIKAIEEASESYGTANSYFREIMKDIELGTSVEEALQTASDTCPSEKMKNIFFQIISAMEVGIDVTSILDSVLEDIAHSQLLEIESYGKKLSGLVLFYMLFAIVMPSLGVAIMIVLASMLSLNLGTSAFFVIAFFLIIMEVLFMTVFKHMRPNLNI